MRKAAANFPTDCQGSALIEYSLVVCAIAMTLLSAITALGDELSQTYQAIITGLALISGGASG
jgi:Flp pilus assembly pilin Flp